MQSVKQKLYIPVENRDYFKNDLVQAFIKRYLRAKIDCNQVMWICKEAAYLFANDRGKWRGKRWDIIHDVERAMSFLTRSTSVPFRYIKSDREANQLRRKFLRFILKCIETDNWELTDEFFDTFIEECHQYKIKVNLGAQDRVVPISPAL